MRKGNEFSVFFFIICLMFILTCCDSTVQNKYNDSNLTSGEDIMIDFSPSELFPNEDARWNTTFGGIENDYGYSIVECKNGGFAIAGATYSYGGLDRDGWIVRCDEQGTTIWNATFGGSEDDYFNDIIECSDGGLAVIGVTNSYGPGREDVWLIKMSADGNQLWNMTYGTEIDRERGRGLIECRTGGLALAGYLEAVGGWDGWLIRTNDTGDIEWTQTYADGGDDRFEDITECANGDFALAGWSGISDSERFWLVRADSSGTQLWSKRYDGPLAERCTSVTECASGGFAMAGWTRSYGAGDIDAWLVRTDQNGNHLWNTTYGGVLSDSAGEIVEAVRGGFAIVGSTTSFGAGNSDMWLIRTNSTGHILWNVTYGGALGDGGSGLVRLQNGAYGLVGSTESYGEGGTDVWLVQTPADYLLHQPIVIDGDDDFILQAWLGDGSENSPYLISGCNIDYNYSLGNSIEIRNTRANFIITDCTLLNANNTNGAGIYMYNVSNAYITQNVISNNEYGIRIEECDSNIIENNICSNSKWQNIFVDWSDSNSVNNNTCTTGEDGILLKHSIYNEITNNTVADVKCGIYVENSESNIIVNNSMTAGGLFIGFSNTLYRQTSVSDNTINGLPIVYWQDRISGVVSPPAGQVILVNCSGVTVQNFILEELIVGIQLSHSNSNFLTNNTCFDCDDGIRLDFSQMNEVWSNKLTGCYTAIELSSSNSSKIEDNDISYCESYSIDVLDSDSNVISFNRFESNVRGIRLYFCLNNEIVENQFNNQEYGVMIRNSDDNHIINNTIATGIYNGLLLFLSDSNELINNTVLNYPTAFYIYSSDSNLVTNNTLQDNGNGILIDSGSDTNSITWNSLIDNTVYNIQNNGTGSVFDYNFYSDFTGSDIEGDGVIDTPYTIPGSVGGSDTHPLMLLPGSGPIWLQTPNDLMIVEGTLLYYDLNATSSPPGLDRWWTNDSANFAIDSYGILVNATILIPKTYTIQILINDTRGVTISAIITVEVIDVNPPTWVETPTDQMAEFGYPFVYDLNATDTAGISHWWLNDTSNFAISVEGVVTNLVDLSLSVYGLQVWVNDTNGLILTVEFSIIVQDTMAPTWDDDPTTQYVVPGKTFIYDLDASDPSGLDVWWINDTVMFTIDMNGIITNITSLTHGSYGIHVYVNDTVGHILEGEFLLLVDYIWPYTHGPIFIDGDDDFLNQGWPGSGSYLDPFRIENLMINISTDSVDCIYIQYTSDYFVIYNCTLISSSGRCISLNYLANGSVIDTKCANSYIGVFVYGCNNITLINNHCFGNSYYGIYIRGGSNHSFIENNCSLNSSSGFYIWSISSSNIINNTFMLNLNGITVADISDSNFTGNSFTNCSNIGLWLQWSEYSIIANNTFNYNAWGIFGGGMYLTITNNTFSNNTDGGLYYSASFADITNNYFIDNNYGIELTFQTHINVIGNFLQNNQYGIYIYDENYDRIENNTCVDNTYGIFISSMSYFNDIIRNVFIDNTYNAKCESTDNSFDLNYYSDYIGIDKNQDGIGDTAYVILGGKASDKNPLMLPPGSHPVWVELPENQTAELDEFFLYDLDATACPPGLDTWWVNDTSFVIDSYGLLSNNTILVVRNYGLEIWCNDTNGNTISAIIRITVQDTTPPVWISPIGDQYFGLDDEIRINVIVFDPSGIDTWTLNDTAFQIDGFGVITNITNILEESYALEVGVNDTFGNLLTQVILVYVDYTFPVWVEEPFDQLLTPFTVLYYDLNASDNYEIHTWWLNDTRFSIDENGVVTNATNLLTGLYPIEVSVNDSAGNVLNGIFTVEVDFTPPYTHDPIVILSNDDFITYGFSGSGTEEDPYIIEYLSIDAAGSGICIRISGTDVYFVIRNCVITGGTQCIYLYGVTNGQIIHNLAQFNNQGGVFLRNSNNNYIAFNNLTHNGYGLYLDNSDENILYMNDCSYAEWYGLRLYSGSSLNTVDSNTVNYVDGSGIDVYSSTNNLIVNNTCTGNIRGIYVSDSAHGNTIQNNTCTLGQDGIYVGYSSNNLILKNTCMNNTYGIRFSGDSTGNTVLNNTCYYNGYGIYLSGGSGHVASYNIATENTNSGIRVRLTSANIVSYNNCTLNPTGISILDSSGNFIIDNLCYDTANYGIYLKNSNNNNVTLNICSSSEYGIYLEGSSNGYLTYNLCTNHTYGIYLGINSQNTLISYNTLHEREYGIFISWSWGNILEHNIISEGEVGISIVNTQYGVTSAKTYGANTIDQNELINNDFYIRRSGDQTITNNIVNGGGFFFEEDYYVDECIQNLVADNFVNGRPLLFWQNVVGGTVPSDVGQVILVNCTSIVVQGHVIDGCPFGIALFHCTNATIFQNDCSNNDYGIYLYYSGYNLIDNNDFSFNTHSGIYIYKFGYNNVTNNVCSGNSKYGIYIGIWFDDVSNNNKVTHNTLLNNIEAGIYLDQSDYNIIDSNICSGSSTGINIYGAWSNWIAHNLCCDDTNGIYIYGQYNTLLNNTLCNNSIGLYNSGGEMSVTRNTIVLNTVGVYLDTYAADCTLTWNVFENSINNTIDNGPNNIFDYNYWSHYQGIDTNLDWIGDSDCILDGTSYNNDTHPLMYPPYPFEWIAVPIDQVIEFGQAYSFEFQTNPIAPIDVWMVNNTLEFSISSFGILTNGTILEPGDYTLAINVTSIWNVTLTYTFTITVEASMPPQWVEILTTQYVEYGEAFRYDLNATDTAGISHWQLNDTSRFTINSEGVITNISSLSVGRYGLLVNVIDIFGNVQTGSFNIVVRDTTPPVLAETSTTAYVEYGSDFVCKLNASDISGVNDWWVDDEIRFTIDWTGRIRTTTILTVGTYGLRAYVSDIYDNTLEISLVVQVQDTTPPELLTEIIDQYLDYGEALDYQLDATDLSEIDHWSVNNTENFAISSTGHLTSIEALTPGAYPLRVTVSDPYDNNYSFDITVYVSSASTSVSMTSSTTISTITTTSTSTVSTSPTTTAPSDGGIIMTIIMIAGIGSVVVVIIIIIMIRKRRGG